MKITILVSLCVLISSLSAWSSPDAVALSRSNGLIRFIAEQRGLRNMALGSIIKNRCNRYMERNLTKPCRDSVSKMISILDFDIILTDNKTEPNGTWNPRNFVFVAFKNNLIQLLSNSKTNTYLYDLNQELYKYLVGEKQSINVWNITRAHYQSDYMTSMVLATLFQDTSMMKLHLAYLERAQTQGNNSFHSNKELLSRVIDTINLILDASEDNYRKIFYPAEVQANLNRNIYHFYVPLFLAKALAREGVPANLAGNTALMLTLSYEFITSANDYRYLYSDPATVTSLHKIKDIYGGYTGSSIGVKGMNFYKNFEVIRASFERSTEDAVMLLLK